MSTLLAILVASLALQLVAAVFALRLVRLTGRRLAWLLIAVALVMMAARRLTLVSAVMSGTLAPNTSTVLAEAIGLLISALLLGGVIQIGPYFRQAAASARAEREAREHLAASELRYRLLAERIEEAFVVVIRGEVVFATPAARSILGAAPEALRGRAIASVLPGLTQPEASRTGDTPAGSRHMEMEIGLPDGARRWVYVRSQNTDWDGQPAQILLIGDATEKRRSEEVLVREERLFSRGPVVLMRWLPSPTRALAFASQNVRQWGFDPDRLIEQGGSFWDLIHPEDRERIAAEAGAYNAAGQSSWEQEYRLCCPDARVRWVYDATVVYRNAGGEITHFDGYLIDISDRKKAEQDLRLSEERFQLATRATRDIMYDWQIGADLLVWNTNTLSVLGYAPEELCGPLHSWAKLVHDGDRERVEEELGHALASGEIFDAEYRFRRKDGTYADIVDRAFIIRDHSGKAVRVVGAMRDVSERTQLEEQLRVAQRIEALGHLAGGVAHDFNNLLTAILGSCELLQRRSHEAMAGRAELDTIHRTASRAAELTRGLLAFARRQVLEPVDVDLNEFVRAELPMLRRLIPENITLDHLPGHQLGTASVDRSQLQQVLVNLCVNARDAMPKGGTIVVETANVTIDVGYVAAHPWAREGRYVMLSVSDNGVGIADEAQAHIFEPFFTTKGPGRGTGLGLATVYGIVKQHDGMIHVYSEPGRGTTMKVYLPMVRRRASEIGEGISGPIRGGSETILVVEDEAEVRKVMVSVLASLGYRVLEAVDGLDALAILSQEAQKVHLVLTDIVMPRMGGKELHEAVLRVAPSTRFLFSSGYSENVVHEGFIKKEGVDFIAKPYGIDALARKVREVLDDARARARMDS
jgi:PAS domain S-box-containing protein